MEKFNNVKVYVAYSHSYLNSLVMVVFKRLE